MGLLNALVLRRAGDLAKRMRRRAEARELDYEVLPAC
jgi:hypothetical protein